MKKLLSALLTLMLLTGCAWAEEAALLPREELHAAIEQLFAAAAGTTEAEEKAARKGQGKEALQQRNDEQAAYRTETLPWLMEAFVPAEDAAEDPAMLPEPTAVPEDWAQAQEEKRLALTAAYEAMMGNPQGAAYLALLAPLGGTDMDSCLAVTQELCRAWMDEIDHVALLEMNGDYTCWLYCAGMNIDYPVVHGADNDRYLSTMFNGEKNASGTLFIDYRNLPDFQDPNTLIYGHHMRDGSMFKSITYYEDQAWFDSHPYMLLISGRETAVLELFAGCTASKRDLCYEIALSDGDDLLALAAALREKSDFASGVEIRPGDRLVTLSTCAYAFEGARYIAVGRIRSAWTVEGM